jgi:hypothetical protein
MNHLALAAASTALVGCVIETADRGHSGDPPGDVAAIAASWSLRNMADGAVTGCPSGFETAQLLVQPIDEAGAALADPIVDRFDCDSQAGTSAGLAPALYQVSLEIRSRDLGALYARSLSQVIDVRRTDPQVAFELLNDGGYFQLSWDLIGAVTGEPLACSQITGLDGISLISTSVPDPDVVYEGHFTCEDHRAVTGGLLHGSYTLSIDATVDDSPIGAAVRLSDQIISSQNGVTQLGQVVIPIDGQ